MYKSTFNITVHGLPYNHAPTATVTSDTTEVPYTYEVNVVGTFPDPSEPGDYQMTIRIEQTIDENNLENNSGNNVSASAWGPFTVTVSASGYNSITITGTEITTEITMEAYIIRLYDDKTDTGYIIKDQNAVCLTGTQTINGQKYFTNHIAVKQNYDSASSTIYRQLTDMDKGTAPSIAMSGNVSLYDKNGLDSKNALARLMTTYTTNNTTRAGLQAFTPVANSTTNQTIDIYGNADGTFTTHAPTPVTSDNSTQIATTAYVNNYLTANTAEAHVVVEKYKNGYSWYRIYDDGWVEQGGRKSSFSAASTFDDVLLLKPMASGSYTVLLTPSGDSTTVYQFKTNNSAGNTTTNVKILCSNSGGACFWTVIGMGA